MDIFAIGLVPSAPVEQVSQKSGEPGFDLALQQVEAGGLIVPPGGPPGPEPPPDILLSAGEGVEGIEPNALPKELDFHPQIDTELSIELPQPFWEGAPATETATETESDSAPVEQAMEWLSGQMLGGFFATPLAPALGTTPPEVKTSEVSAISLTKVSTDFKTVAAEIPAPDFKIENAIVPSGKTETLEGQPVQTLQVPQGTTQQSAEFGQIVQDATGEEAPEVLSSLNLQQVEVDRAQAAVVAERNTQAEKAAETIDQPASQALEAIDLPTVVGTQLLKHAPVAGDPKTPADESAETSEIGSRTAVVEGVRREAKPVRVDTQKGATKTLHTEADEATALEIAPTTSDTQTGDQESSESDQHFGQQVGNNESLEKVLQTEEDTQVKTDAIAEIDIPLGRPEGPDPIGYVESTQTSKPAEAKAEPLQPGEVDSVVKQLSERLHMLAAARPRNGVTIHLNPQDLGEITVVVKAIGRQVDTMLTASDERVREALDQNQDRLVESMSARGFHLQSVGVSQQSGHSTQHDSPKGWQQSNQQQSQSQSGQSQTQQGHRDRPFEQPRNQARNWARRQEGVDLSI